MNDQERSMAAEVLKAMAHPVRVITSYSIHYTKLYDPAQGKAMGTVVHFHGNAQNMSAHYTFVSWLPAHGFNLFVFDYRGYGQSEGTLSREGVYEDSVAAVEYVRKRTDIDPRKIIP